MQYRQAGGQTGAAGFCKWAGAAGQMLSVAPGRGPPYPTYRGTSTCTEYKGNGSICQQQGVQLKWALFNIHAH